MSHPVRIGVLGCGSVVDYAVLQPAREDNAITVAAVASRDAARAADYAHRHQIPRSYGSYEALLRDGEIDAVYVALPNSLHCAWSLAALRAGFPVLCEKPLAANAEQATEMASVAQAAGLLLVEASHWRHHPLASRLAQIIHSGCIGRPRRIDTYFHIPSAFVGTDNIRLDPALGGGSLMDQGCYCVSFIRLLGGGEPTVLSAAAELIKPELDGAMTAHLALPNEMEGSIRCSMNHSGDAIRCDAVIIGDNGRITVDNPFMPGWGSRIMVEDCDGEHVEFPTTTPSYTFQARIFAELLSAKGDKATAWDAVANMRVIDEIYRMAGLRPRF